MAHLIVHQGLGAEKVLNTLEQGGDHARKPSPVNWEGALPCSWRWESVLPSRSQTHRDHQSSASSPLASRDLTFQGPGIPMGADLVANSVSQGN